MSVFRWSLSLVFGWIFAFEVAMALCVSESFANLRRGPGVKWPMTLKVGQYTPFEKIGKERGWYRVRDIDQQIHWVREDLVTQSIRCFAVKNEFAYLRTGPGVQFKKAPVGRADRYVSFRWVKDEGEWTQGEDFSGDLVWIKRDLIWNPKP